MRLVTYRQKNATQQDSSSAAVLVDGAVADIDAIRALMPQPAAAVRKDAFRSVEDVLLAGALDDIAAAVAWFQDHCAASAVPDGVLHAPDAIELLPPVLRPTKVIGVGMNYRSFLEQLGEPVPDHPTLFHKTSSALRGHGQAVVIPPNTDQAVPEGELAVVIGRRASRISAAEADDHIAGFACANDISARNLEFQTSQWTSGKMLETFGPLGPALVTRDEIADVNNLRVRTLLNGQVIQEGNTGSMVFSVQEIISRISMLVPLEVGDVVLTGTPSDLGEVDPPVFLTAQDVIRVEVENVGELENPVIAGHLTERDRSVPLSVRTN